MMLFHYRQRNVSRIIPKLNINDIPIDLVHEFNFLGITIDECMTWHPQINRIASTLSCAIGTFKRLKRYLPSHILKTLYTSLFLPYLNYGILLWGTNLKRIFRLQKIAVRTITNSKYNAHTDPLFKKLSLLKVADIYDLNVLKFYYKYHHQLLPAYFNNILDNQHHAHTYNTRNRHVPRINNPSTTSAEKAIRYLVPKILTKTPTCITEKIYTHSLHGYTSYIKKSMCEKYNMICTIPDCYICNRI